MPAENITNVYNGTDTKKFKRTPEMVRLTLTLTLTPTPNQVLLAFGRPRACGVG